MYLGEGLRHIEEHLWRSLCHCRDLGFNENNAVIVGSAALYVTGVLQFGRDGYPNDIDILTTTDKFEEVCNNHGWVLAHTNGCRGRLVQLEHPENELPIEITCHWPVRVVTDNEIISHSLHSCGTRAMSPVFDLASMQDLKRTKDWARIPVVKERVCGTAAEAFVPWRLEVLSRA